MAQNTRLIEEMNYRLPLIAYQDREALLESRDIPALEQRLCAERLGRLEYLVGSWLEGADIGTSLTAEQATIYNARYSRGIVVPIAPLQFEVDTEGFLAKLSKPVRLRVEMLKEDVAKLKNDPDLRRSREEIAELRKNPEISGPKGKYCKA